MKTATIGLASALFLVGAGAAGPDAPPNDPQIASIVVTANQVEIQARG